MNCKGGSDADVHGFFCGRRSARREGGEAPRRRGAKATEVGPFGAVRVLLAPKNATRAGLSPLPS
jgi:hypothetical protein